jgi:hypothetical protein
LLIVAGRGGQIGHPQNDVIDGAQHTTVLTMGLALKDQGRLRRLKAPGEGTLQETFLRSIRCHTPFDAGAS